MIFGLGYLTAFLSVSRESDGPLAYYATLGLGAAVTVFVVAIICAWFDPEFFIPSGLTLRRPDSSRQRSLTLAYRPARARPGPP